MTSVPLTSKRAVARCLIVRDTQKADKRWHLSDHSGHTLLAASDLWEVLVRAYGLGFEHSTITDNGALYHITLMGIE